MIVLQPIPGCHLASKVSDKHTDGLVCVRAHPRRWDSANSISRSARVMASVACRSAIDFPVYWAAVLMAMSLDRWPTALVLPLMRASSLMAWSCAPAETRPRANAQAASEAAIPAITADDTTVALRRLP